MVKHRADALTNAFGALADPTRRAIIDRLSAGETSVSELAMPFEMSLPAVSKHIRVLERAGIVARYKQGRVYRCRLNAQRLRPASEWIASYTRFWADQLERLDAFVDGTREIDEPAS